MQIISAYLSSKWLVCIFKHNISENLMKDVLWCYGDMVKMFTLFTCKYTLYMQKEREIKM